MSRDTYRRRLRHWTLIDGWLTRPPLLDFCPTDVRSALPHRLSLSPPEAGVEGGGTGGERDLEEEEEKGREASMGYLPGHCVSSWAPACGESLPTIVGNSPASSVTDSPSSDRLPYRTIVSDYTELSLITPDGYRIVSRLVLNIPLSLAFSQHCRLTRGSYLSS